MSVTATTRPAKRSRKAVETTEEPAATPTKATTRKKVEKAAEPAKAASKPAVRDLSEGTEQKFRVDMEEVNETKNCVVFEMPKGSACYGKLWVPKGAVEVIVLVKGVSA